MGRKMVHGGIKMRPSHALEHSEPAAGGRIRNNLPYYNLCQPAMSGSTLATVANAKTLTNSRSSNSSSWHRSHGMALQ